MSIIKYTAFVRIVELGSYSAAAKMLGYSQPGIHHMIKSLEAELGSSLLYNDGKKIVPTSFGNNILNHAQQITKSADSIKNVVSYSSNSNPQIRIAAYNSMLISLLPSILASFSKENPDTIFHLNELNYSECLSAIASNEADLCFMVDARPGGYDFIPLIKDPVLIVMQKSNPLAAYDKIPIKELNGIDLLTHKSGCDDNIETVLQEECFTPNNKLYMTHDTPILELIRTYGGVGILSSLSIYNMSHDLTYRPLVGDVHRTLGIVLKSSQAIEPYLADFIETAKSVTKEFCKRNGLEAL